MVIEDYQITLCCGGTVIITIITGTLLCHDSISRRELMLLREGQSRRLKQPCFIKQMHTTRSSANNDITDVQQKRSALVFSPCFHQHVSLWMPALGPRTSKGKKTNDAFRGRDGHNVQMSFVKTKERLELNICMHVCLTHLNFQCVAEYTLGKERRMLFRILGLWPRCGTVDGNTQNRDNGG